MAEIDDGKDKNVGSISIEEDIKIIESTIEEYEDCSVPGLDMQVDVTFREKQCNALKNIIADYKRLKEDFKDIDHECSRLEDIDIRKDLKIIKLQEENKKQEDLIERMKRFLFKESKMCDFLESEE